MVEREFTALQQQQQLHKPSTTTMYIGYRGMYATDKQHRLSNDDMKVWVNNGLQMASDET
jgi:hypothetical protein